MADANKDEADKCKQIARTALSTGDNDKAVRFLQKAKRMCPGDTSIDALLAQASSGNTAGSSSSTAAGDSSNAGPTDGPRYRGAQGTSGATSAAGTAGASRGAGSTRMSKDGSSYTSEQMQMVQRILRTKDYYDILEVPREANEEAVKKAYKKLALKLHPDKNKAPGAEEAFKKLSKAVQCLTDEEKKSVYDKYGDEERIPHQHRQAYQQDFMNPEDLFASFFGGGGAAFHTFHHHHGHRGHDHEGSGQVQRQHLLQMLPVLLLVLLTLASNFASRDGGSRFSFTQTPQYRNERSNATPNVSYYVTDEFDEHYPEGARYLAEFERQVEIYYVRTLHSECDQQEKMMFKKAKLQDAAGFQLAQQCLHFAGKRLEDGVPLSRYNIQEGPVLHLINIAPTGGPSGMHTFVKTLEDKAIPIGTQIADIGDTVKAPHQDNEGLTFVQQSLHLAGLHSARTLPLGGSSKG